MVEDIILTMMLAPTTDVRGEGDSTMKTEWRRIDSDLQGGGSEQNQNMREMRRGRRYGAAERGDVRGPSAEGGDADGDAGMVWRRRGRRSMGTGWRRSDDDLRGKRAVSDGDLMLGRRPERGRAEARRREDIQPWASPLEQYNVVGEDEADYFEEMGPIRETVGDIGSGGEDAEVDEESGLGQLDIKFPGRAALGENSHKHTNLTNLSTNTEIINLSSTQAESAKISTFRIKRMNGSEGTKDSPCRPIQSRSDKENAKTPSSVKKPEFRTGPVSKMPSVQSASNSMYLTKAPEKLAEVYGVKENASDKTVKTTKAPLKLGTGVFGALATDDYASATAGELEPDRKAKSAAYLSLGRISNQKNGLGSKGQNKKLGLNLAPHLKDQSNGNFLVPRVFELNIQGTKADQSKENAVYSGLKSFGRSLSKGLIIPRDNQSSAVSACLYEAPFSTKATI